MVYVDPEPPKKLTHPASRYLCDSWATYRILRSPYNHDDCTAFYDQQAMSNDVVSRKDVHFRGHKNGILHFDPIFANKGNLVNSVL